MPPRPSSRFRPLSSLLFTLAVGCGGAPEEQGSPELLATESQALQRSPRARPPGLAPSLMKDIQVGDLPNYNLYDQNTGSRPYPVSTGSVVYFRSNTGSTGMELWRTDGTAEGTRLVRDLIPGPGDSSITEMVTAGDTLYFVQRNSFYGPLLNDILWKSDGTAEGTVPFRTAQGSTLTANELIVCNGLVYFHGVDSQNRQLWRTDGTPEGTVLLTTATTFDYRPNTAPAHAICVDGTLFFLGSTGPYSYSYELWKSDGTASGTVKLSPVGSVMSSWKGYPVLAAVGSRVFLNTSYFNQPLWTSDGTPEGTRRLPNVGWQAGTPSPEFMAAVNGKLFFTTFNWGMGTGLWTSDGTPEGTSKYLDLRSGPPPASPISLSVVGDTVLFTSNSRLYKSDGTAEGTVPFENLTLGTQAGMAPGVVLPDGRMLFAATESGATRAWVSDGTEAGTTELRTAQDQVLKWPSRFTRLGDRVLLWANEGVHGVEPWVTDGTPEGTRLVRDTFRVDASDPRNLTDVEGTLFFTAYDAANHRELWKTDGTAEGTGLVKVLGPHSWNEPSRLTRVGSSLFFFTEVNSLALWKSDGTEAGTVRLRDFGTLVGASWTRAATLGSSLIFSAYEFSTGIELWKSDGTAEGTVLLKDLVSGAMSSAPERLTTAGDLVFFIANDVYTSGYELWRTDGTAEGTFLVKDIYPGRLSGMNAQSSGMYAVGGTLFFTANDGVHGVELWKTDGTAEGTVLVKDLRPGTLTSGPSNLAEVNGELFFTADDGVHGRELWKTDGTAEGTVLVADLVAGAGSSGAESLRGLGGNLYFVANDGVHGAEPWKSDGTAAGTVLLRDVMPGPLGSGVGLSGFVPVGPHGAVVFSASNGLNGVELWVTDGTPAGTRLHSDLAPGAMSSSPLLLTVSGPRLFFVADEGEHGRELWSVKQAAFINR